ncbi:MAG: hypothetical protein H5U04_12790 [Firmicutes bacterium]|nr:hypothetical protein [Bacillota bacterium]
MSNALPVGAYGRGRAGLEEAVALARLGRILNCARGELELALEEAREDLRIMLEISNP